ncbi:hypothetical protein [Clostridium oceanicum]|uniref:Uncharacterized protein n=1 Tax=Clostridium oceanicum TaxID=1543 RepID=A0ABP3UKF6_9CLOT
MKYNSDLICEKWRKKCSIKDTRIEWLKDKEHNCTDIYMCHKQCSEGYNSPTAVVGDIDLISPINNEDVVYNKLNKMKKVYKNLSNKIDKIIVRLFKTI